MKNTEQISLGGFAFIIEDDAYVQLKTYLEEIKDCFRNDSGADEIVADIEERIAELLKEKYKDGGVVSSAMIDEIKVRIGNPKELGGQADEPCNQEKEPESQKNPFRQKRLYRDTSDRMLGGVCSGLSHYFNIDKAILRLFFLIVFCLGFLDVEEGLFSLSIVVYIIMWIAIPAAKGNTSVEREIKKTAESPAVRKGMRIISAIVGVIPMVIGFGGFIAAVMLLSIPSIAAERFCLDGAEERDIFLVQEILLNNVFWWVLSAVIGLASIGLLYAGIRQTFNLKTPSWRPGLIIFILWLISLAVAIAWITCKVVEFNQTFL